MFKWATLREMLLPSSGHWWEKYHLKRSPLKHIVHDVINLLYHKRRCCLTFLLLRFILDHIFCPKKDNLFCPVLVFHRCVSSGICDLILHLKKKGAKISRISRYSSILVLKNSVHNTAFCFASGWTSLKCNMTRFKISQVNLGKNKYICLSFLKFDF